MKNFKSVLLQILIPIIVAFIVYLSSCYADFLNLKIKVIEQEKGIDKVEKKIDVLDRKIDRMLLNFSKVMYERNYNDPNRDKSS